MEKTPKRRGAKFWLKAFAPVLASIAGLLTLRLLGPDILDQETLRRWLQPLGVWAPVAFVLMLSVRPITLLPGQVFTAVGGILFGIVPSALYSLAGSLGAMVVVFFLSKKLGTRFMKRFAGHKYDALRKVARKHDFKAAVLVTMNPLFPTDVLIALAGASGARFWPTALGVLVGTAPGTFLTAAFGSALGAGKTIMTAITGVAMVASMILGVILGRKMVSDFDEEAARHPKPAPEPEPGSGASPRFSRSTRKLATPAR